MNLTKNQSITKIYAPVLPCKHHITNGQAHETLGKYMETIVSKRVSFVLKAVGVFLIGYFFYMYAIPLLPAQNNYEQILFYLVPVFFVGYALYFLLFIPCKVTLYEKGLVHKTLFSCKEYYYATLIDFRLKVSKQYELDTCGQESLLWSFFHKQSYCYYECIFSDTRGFVLKPIIYCHLEEKVEHLMQNLIKGTVE